MSVRGRAWRRLRRRLEFARAGRMIDRPGIGVFGMLVVRFLGGIWEFGDGFEVAGDS